MFFTFSLGCLTVEEASSCKEEVFYVENQLF